MLLVGVFLDEFLGFLFADEAEDVVEDTQGDEVLVITGEVDGAVAEKEAVLYLKFRGDIHAPHHATDGVGEHAEDAFRWYTFLFQIGCGGGVDTIVGDVAVLLFIGTGGNEDTHEDGHKEQGYKELLQGVFFLTLLFRDCKDKTLFVYLPHYSHFFVRKRRIFCFFLKNPLLLSLQNIRNLLFMKNPLMPFVLQALLFSPMMHAQEDVGNAFLQTTISTGFHASTGDYAPFWLTANQHGAITTDPRALYLRAAVVHAMDKEKEGFDWGFGIDALSPGYDRCQLQQCYADVRYNVWQLTLGSKEYDSQGKNQRLTTGGMTWSGNARPIPQARFGIEEYATVPFTKGWASVKGFISYGCMTDNRYQREFVQESPYALYNQDALFHEKSAFLKVGNRDVTPFSVELGVEMDCMFGGTLWEHDARRSTDDTDQLIFTNPQTASDFIKALVPLNGGESSTISDQRNAAGNHFGSLHAAANYECNDWRVRGYYEHYFESRCGMTPWNATRDMDGQPHNWIPYPWKDGLWGLEVTLPKNPFVSTVVAEYNFTRDQCGSVHHGASANLPATIYGFACYYYNSSYPSWHHYGRTAGSPLLYNPCYNGENNHTHIITNTRISACHLGLEGQPLPAWGYRLLGTWERSWGSYIDPLPTPGTTFSTLAELTWTPARPQPLFTYATAAFALDRSSLIGNTTGFCLTLSKTL